MFKPYLFCAVSMLAVAQPTPSAAQPAPETAEETRPMSHTEEAHGILERFASDYRTDPMAISGTFGIRLGDDWWTVSIARAEEAYTPEESPRLTFHRFGPHDVTLARGAPRDPTWYFEISGIDVLRMIASGDINAGTAAMQSFGSDQVGVETRAMDGFTMNSGAEGELYLALSHFFTTGVPEVTRFGREESLPTHGIGAVALHMMKGFRVLHFNIAPEEVANDDPRLEFGQMPNLFIVTRGRGQALLGDQEIELEEGMSVFVAPYVRHVIRNPYDEPMEGIVVLYGDNSDFAFGTSYPAYLEAQNAFHAEYPFRQ
jgi:mannose-6-phosphate isomerase-like protein (cupin superfamily)